MTTITPPPPPQALPAQPAGSPVVVVQNPPSALTGLALGSLLKATVLGPAGKDAVHLQTALGQLTVQTALTLPKQGTLTLQLQTLAPLVQLVINAVNGRPLAASLRPTGSPATTAPGTQGALSEGASASPGTGKASAGTQSARATATPLKAGDTVQANLLRALGTPGAAQQPIKAIAGTPQNTTTAPPLDKAAAAQQPATALSGKAAKTAATQTAAQTPQAATTAAKATATAAPDRPLPLGSQLSVKITAIQLAKPGGVSAPSTGTPGSPTLAMGRTIRGTVTGTTASGNPVVQTNAGVLSLTTQSPPPRGSVITFQVTGMPAKSVGGQPFHVGMESDSLFLNRKWPALEEAIKVVHEQSPETARHLAQTSLPRPGAQLTNGLLFFMAALKGGNMRAWIGEASARLVENTQPNLLSRLGDDFASMARIADEPSTGDWRTFLMPVNTGEMIDQIRMLLRRGDDENDDDTASGTRFVVDVNLTRIGRMQLDGLVRSGGKHMDLIIRSEHPLPAGMNDDIRGIFQDSAEQTGLQGGISFQATPPGFIEVADPLGSDGDVGGEHGLLV